MNNIAIRIFLYSLGFEALNKIKNKTIQNKQNKNIINFRGVLEVRHYIPGRIRYFMPALKNNRHIEHILLEQLSKVDVIKHININVVTGTILICYEKNNVNPSILSGAIISILGLQKQVNNPESLVKKEMKNMKDSLNLAVYDKTKGILDMKTILVLVLIFGGVKKFMLRPEVAPGGITYLWWAYSNFK